MKFLWLWICVLAGLGGLCACQRSRASSPPKAVPMRADGVVELNLTSFNVRCESPEDRDSRAWRERIAGAQRMIRRQRPDCIGVQETLHGQAAGLWASLPDYEFFGVGRDDGKQDGEYSGIFYQSERFRPDAKDCGSFWLSDTPERAGLCERTYMKSTSESLSHRETSYGKAVATESSRDGVGSSLRRTCGRPHGTEQTRAGRIHRRRPTG